jgi:hypothetical protein
LSKNLFGIEIDERASQLAAFALLMKAAEDDRLILEKINNDTKKNTRDILNCSDLNFQLEPPVYLSENKPLSCQIAEVCSTRCITINESNYLDAELITRNLNEPNLATNNILLPDKKFAALKRDAIPLINPTSLLKDKIDLSEVKVLINLFKNAKTFGALIRVPETLSTQLETIKNRIELIEQYGDLKDQEVVVLLKPLIRQAEILAQKYDFVVTNPPYMGNKYLNATLKKFATENYPNTKNDLFAMFIERNIEFAEEDGLLGFMTPFVWMFISSYEKLRVILIDSKTITSLIQLEYSGFDGATVPICIFTLSNSYQSQYKGNYIKLSDFRGADNQSPKTLEAIQNPSCGWFFRALAADFKKLPGSPIAYWISLQTINNFVNFSQLSTFTEAKSGMSSCNSDRFLRQWFEVSWKKICIKARSQFDAKNSMAKWFPYNKGGGNRKWYGYNNVLINWANEGNEIKQFVINNDKDPDTTHWSRRLFNLEVFFRQGITWSSVTSGKFSCRVVNNGVIPGTGSITIYELQDSLRDKIFSLLNCKVSDYYLSILCPTINFTSGDVIKIPVAQHVVINESVIKKLLFLSQSDWDSYETSWNFSENPLVRLSREIDSETTNETVRD